MGVWSRLQITPAAKGRCGLMIKRSRQDAVRIGAKHYFSGTPCINGHIANRLTNNYNCIICNRARSKEWQRGYHKLYWVWKSMRARCHYRKHRVFHRYGGRGIKICKRWDIFSNFVADMGPRPKGTTLDRIDNDGNYTKRNCKWSTAKEQMRNCCQTKYLSLDGVRRPLTEWAEISGISKYALHQRVRNGWPMKRAIWTPMYGKRTP